MGLNKLELVPARHGTIGIHDIMINGLPLAQRIQRHEGERCDRVSPLGWIDGAYERLGLQAPADLPGGRTSLLVCPQCGDLGCGAVSAVISRSGDMVTWDELGIASTLETGEGPWLFSKVTGFRFAWESYSRALRLPL